MNRLKLVVGYANAPPLSLLRASRELERVYPRELVCELKQVKMQWSLKPRVAIMFCVKLEKTVMETVSMIKSAYKEDTLSDR